MKDLITFVVKKKMASFILSPLDKNNSKRRKHLLGRVRPRRTKAPCELELRRNADARHQVCFRFGEKRQISAAELTQSVIHPVPGAREEVIGRRDKIFLPTSPTRTACVTLDPDPVVFSIFSGWAAGQAGVQTRVLHLLKKRHQSV